MSSELHRRAAPRMLPWTDRQGRFAPLKAVVLVAVLLPGLVIAARLMTGGLGAKPVTAALHETGLWSLRLLLVTLAVTPLRLITGWGRVLAVRRMLGVAALGYALVHLGLYVFEQGFDLLRVASEIARRFYLTIGFLSLLAMAALGATSFDSAIRRLGAARWNRLHALIHPLTLLALWHGALQAKIDIFEHAVMTGIFLALISLRLMRRAGVPLDPPRLLALVPVAMAATMALEYLWYALATGVPADRILAANFIEGLQPRPALVVGMLVTSLPVLAILVVLCQRSRVPERPIPGRKV
ncbi:MAG: sulfoxide reductase heme-binding subunit YedZ [Hyphomicrobiales bacterium]|nr:sulfoxide reductase heme-binding subunit YedZ [Hyphomicrobiales bacterium]